MARKARKKSKGMGIKTSVKSGNFLATSKGAGMTKKGVAAYRKANPGSKLKTAVTESKPTGKRAKRRKSYCSRSKGQMKMHNINCKKLQRKEFVQQEEDGNVRWQIIQL
jgi:hypothetical protein